MSAHITMYGSTTRERTNMRKHITGSLPGTLLGVGQPVAYSGPDESRGIYEKWTRPQVLKTGHPGRITDSTIQHIKVDWAGLEHEPASYAAGFCLERRDSSDEEGFVPGLTEISEEEYEKRVDRIERGTGPEDR